jgi:hypothetical protein
MPFDVTITARLEAAITARLGSNSQPAALAWVRQALRTELRAELRALETADLSGFVDRARALAPAQRSQVEALVGAVVPPVAGE